MNKIQQIQKNAEIQKYKKNKNIQKIQNIHKNTKYK